MPITRDDFVGGLLDAAPEVRLLVEEHLRDQGGELLLHLLVGDLARYCQTAFQVGDKNPLHRVLDYLDVSLREGDEQVENAVCLSFVENVGPWDPEMRPFIEAWPVGLRAEAERQAQAR